MVASLGLEIKGVKIEVAAGQGQDPCGGGIFYKGVKIFQPYYYQSISGDIPVSVTVEFDLGEPSKNWAFKDTLLIYNAFVSQPL